MTDETASDTSTTTVAQQLEAILLIVDEPQSLVSLATAGGALSSQVRSRRSSASCSSTSVWRAVTSGRRSTLAGG